MTRRNRALDVAYATAVGHHVLAGGEDSDWLWSAKVWMTPQRREFCSELVLAYKIFRRLMVIWSTVSGTLSATQGVGCLFVWNVVPNLRPDRRVPYEGSVDVTPRRCNRPSSIEIIHSGNCSILVAALLTHTCGRAAPQSLATLSVHACMSNATPLA